MLLNLGILMGFGVYGYTCWRVAKQIAADRIAFLRRLDDVVKHAGAGKKESAPAISPDSRFDHSNGTGKRKEGLTHVS